MKKVLVTGADGQLGSQVVRELLSRDYVVRGLVQPGRPAATLKGLDVEIVHGDILDPEQLRGPISGCDAVIHTAASTVYWPRRSSVPIRVNVDGTRNVVEATLASGVERLVHVGSASSFCPGTGECPGDEGSPNDGSTYRMAYIESKHRSQEIVLDAVRRRGLQAVVVCPTFLIGPYGDPRGSSSLMLELFRGSVPYTPPGGRNFVYTGDVAVAICNAMEVGTIGECYILGNENLSLKDAFRRLCDVMGVDPPRKMVGRWAMYAAGVIKSLQGVLTRRNPGFSYGVARVTATDWFYNPAKARREIGLPKTPLETAATEAWQWFKETNCV